MTTKELIEKLGLNPYASLNGQRYCQVSSEIIREITKRLEWASSQGYDLLQNRGKNKKRLSG